MKLEKQFGEFDSVLDGVDSIRKSADILPDILGVDQVAMSVDEAYALAAKTIRYIKQYG